MIDGPAHYIGLMLLTGMMMGTVFDIYNTVTSAAKWLWILRSILDISFFVTFAYIVFRISLFTDNGRFRLYTFGLLIMGYVIYRILFHRVIVASAHVIIQMIRTVFMMVWKLVNLLVIHPIQWMMQLVIVLFRGIYQIGCKIENIICKCISVIVRLVLFPLKGYIRILSRLSMKVQPYQEGIWLRLSNWLKRHPKGA